MTDRNRMVHIRCEKDDPDLDDSRWPRRARARTPDPSDMSQAPRIESERPQSAKGRPRFAMVYVDVPISCEGPAFHYEIPVSLLDDIRIGSRVRVPFGKRKVDGWVAGFVDVPEVESVKPVLSVLDRESSLDEGAFDLARRVAERYQCPLSEVIKAMVPAYTRNPPTGRHPKSVTVTGLGSSCTPATPQGTDAQAGSGGDILSPGSRVFLTPDQGRAVERIRRVQRERRHAVFVLFGVTGSGKTEVYLKAMEEALSEGRQALMLVPEIALTPQTVDRLRSRFGAEVAVLHSGISRREGYETYKRVRSRDARVVLGARSAVFAPCPDPGVIVLDEEHEFTYKQSEEPRYHAREVAIMKSNRVGGVTILGSATPSIETFYKAKKGEYELVTLPSRIKGLGLPNVHIVDMRKVFGSGSKGVISPVLRTKIEETLSRGAKVILFVNRRGYSPFVLCRECGYVERCPNCKVSLTFHLKERAMICHYCGYRKRPPEKCPACGGGGIKLFGVGTERVEEAVKVAFKDANVARLDSDTTTKRGAHRVILDGFRKGPVNVLVGTQMVAKGLDISEVSLVGVISADTTLYLPDFRAA
ncbi:MAG TPA: primosomal protein N', partial [Clostridia bacterium]|nr:primosomal protein N' [Clostridia bacterium]